MSKYQTIKTSYQNNIKYYIRTQKVPSLFLFLKLIVFCAIIGQLPDVTFGQYSDVPFEAISYTDFLSKSRIQELENMARHIEDSIDVDKAACSDYYDYACSRDLPVYSILGHLPNITQIINLMDRLQGDEEYFEAKQKIDDFFVSCNMVKRIEECYRESFEYFKPIFGYIITKYYIDRNSHEHQNFLNVLDQFLKTAGHIGDFVNNPIKIKLSELRTSFNQPKLHFSIHNLNNEYKSLRIYRESYEHNLRNLEQHRKSNSTYKVGVQRVMLDWTLYVFQSKNKPMSYFFPTLNVHLWMTLYNNTIRYYERERLQEQTDCLNLPQHVNMLEEARIMALVYLKSFRNAWKDFTDWIKATRANLQTHDQENEILRKYHLTNKTIFFILYAQNFCDFGKDLAEHIFYLGLKETEDFRHVYCGATIAQRYECVQP